MTYIYCINSQNESNNIKCMTYCKLKVYLYHCKLIFYMTKNIINDIKYVILYQNGINISIFKRNRFLFANY